MHLQPVTFEPHVEAFSSQHLEALKAFAQTCPLEPPYHVEIGSNRGRFLVGLAGLDREASVLGLELRQKWAQHAQQLLDRGGLHNARSVYADANLAIPLFFADASIARVFILFPDPWWKKRHAKRRIISSAMLQLLSAKLSPGGLLILKTDVEPYAAFARELLATCPQLRLLSPDDPAWPSDEARWPHTNREVRILEHGLPVFRLYAQRTEVPADPDAIAQITLERFPKPELMLPSPRA